MKRMNRLKRAVKRRASKPLTSHWEGVKPDPRRFFGFIYLIEDHANGRLYIGKKQFYSARQGSPKSRCTDRQSPKWNPTHWNPSKWEIYSGSSKHLTNSIKEHGDGHFTFTILHQHRCKGDLHYAEVVEQVCRGVLVKKCIDNPDVPLYYNRQIGAVRFVPPHYKYGDANELST